MSAKLLLDSSGFALCAASGSSRICDQKVSTTHHETQEPEVAQDGECETLALV